jgi:hypothetical protein
MHDLKDNGTVHQFLRRKYIYWLEALGLLQGMSAGVLAITNLESLLVGEMVL